MQPQQNLKMRCSPSGVHLFHGHSGLNILCDELRVPVALWASAPRQISVALTNACNLSCSYCYAPKHRASLKVEQLMRWLGDWDEHGCLGVGFGGGEPTLHPDFVEICQKVARETAPVHGTSSSDIPRNRIPAGAGTFVHTGRLAGSNLPHTGFSGVCIRVAVQRFADDSIIGFTEIEIVRYRERVCQMVLVYQDLSTSPDGTIL